MQNLNREGRCRIPTRGIANIRSVAATWEEADVPVEKAPREAAQ